MFDVIVAPINIVGPALVVTGGSGAAWQYILHAAVAIIAAIYALVAHRNEDSR